MTKHLRVLLLIAGASLEARTQVAPPVDYSGEAVVFERISTDISIDEDGSATRTMEVRARVQSAAGVQQIGTLTVPYSRGLGSLDVQYVRVRKAAGTIVETPPASAIELPADVTREAPTYTDVYVKHVNVQGLAVGDVLEYAFRLHTRSLIPGHYWLEESVTDPDVVLSGELRVSMPASPAPTVKTRGSVQPTVSTEGGRRQYTWRYSNLKRLSERDIALRVYDVSKHRTDIEITNFKDWSELGEAIQALWRDRAVVTPAIREKALALTRGATSDGDRLLALYRFVSTEVRYVAVALGLGRIQPNTAAEILANGFGDCKDKHTLLVALLSVVGIRAEAALIGSGEAFDRDVPSLLQFNHVITVVQGSGGTTWLDTTLEVAPLGLLILSERDKEVLLLPDSGAASLAKTPAVPVRANEWRMRTEGTITEQGQLRATVEETVSGESEVFVRTVFRRGAAASWPDLIRQFPLASRFGGSASDVTVTPIEDTTGPFTIKYRYTVDSFSEWADKQISPVLPFVVRQLADSPAPATPVSFGVPGAVIAVSRLELPNGFNATLAPGSVPEMTIDRDFAKYTVRSSLRGRVFEVEREFFTKTPELALAEVGAYRDFYKAVSAVPAYVTLRAVTPWTWGQGSTIDWYGGASASAVSTMGSAVAASRRGDHQAALSALDELTKREPKTPAVWVMLGWAQIESGDRNRGLDTLRRSAEATPSPAVYKMLAQSLWRVGLRAESAAALARGRERYPDDHEFALHLGETLTTLRRFAEAIPILVGAVGYEPTSARLQWNLGKAYLGDGKSDLGVAALRQAAALDSSPRCLNDVAWELAVARLALDDARQFSERAVTATEEQAAKITLGTLDAAALQTMSRLAMYWDTLAWTYFRRGDLATAERYLLPAWDLMQTGIYAEHLGEVYEAKADRAAAALYYARALAAPSPDDSADARLQTLVVSAVDRAALTSEARAGLGPLRSVSVPRFGDAKGTADVFVLIGSTGKIEDLKFIGGSDPLRPIAETVRAVPAPSRLPGSGTAKVVRRARITCGEGPSCDVQFTPAGSVTSVN